MLTTLAAAALMAAPLSNEPLRTADLAVAAQEAGFEIYVPQGLPVGYELREAVIVNVAADGQLPGLGSRKAVRLNYRNDRVSHEFDLVQSKSSAAIKPERHGRRLVEIARFPIHIEPTTTVVGVKKGSTDVAFFGSLISEASAKTLMGDLRRVRR